MEIGFPKRRIVACRKSFGGFNDDVAVGSWQKADCEDKPDGSGGIQQKHDQQQPAGDIAFQHKVQNDQEKDEGQSKRQVQGHRIGDDGDVLVHPVVSDA